MYIKEEGGPEKRKQFNPVLKACTSEICVQSTLPRGPQSRDRDRHDNPGSAFLRLG